MKCLVVGIAAVLIAATGMALGNANAPTDEDVVRALPQRIVDGWSKGSGQAIADVYADDGTLVAGDGTFKKGRAEIAEYHDRQFVDFLKGTRLTVAVRSVRFLGPNIALMQTEGGILWPGQQQLAPGNNGIQSFVAVKERGVWRVLLFQNTRVLPKRSQSP
jgi:uncharacterized protein (TIGR02246 family)